MLLSVEQVTKSYGDRVLLDGVSFYLERGDKVGIIGVNGAGKSTLLRLLAGAEEPDGGTVRLDPGVRMEYLPQNPVFQGERTVLEQVLLGLNDADRSLAEYEARTILNQLGVSRFEQSVGNLSGGERRRVALAAVIAPLAIYKIGAVFEHNIMGFRRACPSITFKAVQVIIEVRDGVIEDMGFSITCISSCSSRPLPRGLSIAADALLKTRTAPTRIPSTPICWRGHYAAVDRRGVPEGAGHGVLRLVHTGAAGRRFAVARAGGPGERRLHVRPLPFLRLRRLLADGHGRQLLLRYQDPTKLPCAVFGFGRARVLGSLAHHPLDVAARFRVHARGEVGHAAQAVQRAPAYCLFRLSRELHAHGCLARADGRLFGVRRILRRTHGGDGRVPEEVAVS